MTRAYHKKGISSLSRPAVMDSQGIQSPYTPAGSKKRRVDFKSQSSFRSNSISIREPGETERHNKIDREVYDNIIKQHSGTHALLKKATMDEADYKKMKQLSLN